MKIVTKDNFNRDLFKERVIAENVDEHLGKELIDRWNDAYWDEHCKFYLALVEDDYVLYDGYAENF